MSTQLTLAGTLQIGGDACGVGCGAGSDRTIRGLSLRCTSSYFQSAFSTDIPVRVQTVGLVGSEWVELPVTSSLISIGFLMVETDQAMQLRIGAAPAVLTGSGGTFPTLFAGGEGLSFELDGVAVATVFTSGDQTALQCAARINAACAYEGLATPRASVSSAGQLVLTGVLTGTQGQINTISGSGAATLGIFGEAVGEGADVDVFGLFLNEFPTSPDAPARVQISGVGNVSVVAAGRTV